MAPRNNIKRKSRFRKAPQAPKRFKSAYIFFSTDMMQRIKTKQNAVGGDKQKITDISKRISQAWKTLPDDERKKWNLIAKKDKERFIAEKNSYKGPWQLPIKSENEDPNPAPKFKTNGEAPETIVVTASEDSALSYSCSASSRRSSTCTANETGNGNGLPCIPNLNENIGSSSRERLNSISKEEQDAALNLVSLFRQSKSGDKRSICSSSSIPAPDNRASNTARQASVPFLSFNPQSQTMFPLSPRSHIPQQMYAQPAPLQTHLEYYQPQYHQTYGPNGSVNRNGYPHSFEPRYQYH